MVSSRVLVGVNFTKSLTDVNIFFLLLEAAIGSSKLFTFLNQCL